MKGLLVFASLVAIVAALSTVPPELAHRVVAVVAWPAVALLVVCFIVALGERRR